MPHLNGSRWLLFCFLITIFSYTNTLAQDKKTPAPPGAAPVPAIPPVTPPKTGPKPYKEVITDKAKTTKGLFTIHKVEDKWYFEIPDA